MRFRPLYHFIQKILTPMFFKQINKFHCLELSSILRKHVARLFFFSDVKDLKSGWI